VCVLGDSAASANSAKHNSLVHARRIDSIVHAVQHSAALRIGRFLPKLATPGQPGVAFFLSGLFYRRANFVERQKAALSPCF